MTPFHEFAELLPPLDTQRLAQILGIAWERAYEEAIGGVKLAIENMHSDIESHPRIHYSSQAKYMEKIISALQAYDEGRTRHIKWLTDEVVRLHSLLPSPHFVYSPTNDEVKKP